MAQKQRPLTAGDRPSATSNPPPVVPKPATGRGSAFVCALLALLLGYLAVRWVVGNELIHSSIFVGNAVPPIPALAALLAMGGAAALVRRARRRAGDASGLRAEILTVYLFLSIS
jgi:hypothetical protein